MGKLTIRVKKCSIHRPSCSGSLSINPRVHIVVDDTYRFQTHTKKNTFEPEFNEHFVVGNTHRLAIVEVSVYDVHDNIGFNLAALNNVAMKNVMNRTGIGGGGGDADEFGLTPRGGGGGAGTGLGGSSGPTSGVFGGRAPTLLGRCYVSIQRLLNNQPKTRTYTLGTPIVSSAATAGGGGGSTGGGGSAGPSSGPSTNVATALTPPSAKDDASIVTSLLFPHQYDGIAGSITLTLESDTLGESPQWLLLNDKIECEYVSQLQRFLLRYDKPKVQMIDVIIGHVRDASEYAGRRSEGDGASVAAKKKRKESGAPDSGESTLAQSLILSSGSVSNATISGSLAGGTGKRGASEEQGMEFVTVCLGGLSELTMRLPVERETFLALFKRLCDEVQGTIPALFHVAVRVHGCTNINRDKWNQSIIGSDDVYVILRTNGECFTTGYAALQKTIVWSEENEFTIDVVNPLSTFIDIFVIGKKSGHHYEIGRSRVSVFPLSLGHESSRNLFLCSPKSLTSVEVNGLVHVAMTPSNFGLIPSDAIGAVDIFYDRLGKFFRRYDPLRLPEVDRIIHARVFDLEEYMSDLVVVYGREPGAARLHITVNSIMSLCESAAVELTQGEVVLIIAMGVATVRSKPVKIRRFEPIQPKETFLFDVVRETDLIRIEVVSASNNKRVYGRVDFCCLNVQRGEQNTRSLYLVGEAGTPEAYFSGVLEVSLYSEEIGHEYVVDTATERAYTGRLRRYTYRRLPEQMHRVNLIVATVFDLETFMAKLSAQYGQEDPTYALFFTVSGCRQMSSRLGGLNPYVVVRVGLAAYQTRILKDTTEPDYFEYCEFYFDRPSEVVIILIVMDHSDIGDDEEIGRAVVPLTEMQPGKHYHDWLPLMSERKKGKLKEVGTIEVKYYISDLNIVDSTRYRITRGEPGGTQHNLQSLPAPDTRREKQSIFTSGPQLRLETAPSASGQQAASDGASSGTTASPRGTAGLPGIDLSRQWDTFRRRFARNSEGRESGSPGSPYSARRAMTGLFHHRDSSDSEEDGDGQSTSAGSSATQTGRVRTADADGILSRYGGSRPTYNLMDEAILTYEQFCLMPNSCDTSLRNTDTEEATDSDFDAQTLGTEDSGVGLSASGKSMSATFNDVEALGERQLEKSLKDAESRADAGVGAVSGGAEKMVLRVRLLSCAGLERTSLQAPNPYIMLGTIGESHRSRTCFATTEPRFNEVFTFKILDPRVDYLSLTVMTDTPYGSKKIGHCVMSVKNVPRGAARTRRTALVLQSHRPDAIEVGSVYLSLSGVNFGMDYLPSADAENRLRERVREYLLAESRAQLHRLEWYVGEFCNFESLALGGLFSLAQQQSLEAAKSGQDSSSVGTMAPVATVRLYVSRITHLYRNNLLSEGTVLIKYKVGTTTKAKTQPVTGSQGQYEFAAARDTVTFDVENPTKTLIRVSVLFNGRHKSGECFLSLSDLYRGRPKERVLMLVMGSRSPRPEPIGFFYVSMCSDNFGSSAAPPTGAELDLHTRLTHFFYYYVPSLLAMVDVKYATTLNVEAYLNRLSEKYGPEPGEFGLKVTVDKVFGGHSAEGQGEIENLYVVIRVGMQEYRTTVARGSLSNIRFGESFQTVLGLPSRERAEVLLMQYAPAKSTLLGRATIPLETLRRGTPNELTLGIISGFGTKSASLVANVRLYASTSDFGREGLVSRTTTSMFYPHDHEDGDGGGAHAFVRGPSTLVFDPNDNRKGLRTATSSLRNSFADGGKDAHEAEAASKSPKDVAVRLVRIVGLAVHNAEVYVRVTEKNTSDKALYRSKPMPCEALSTLQAEFTIPDARVAFDATFTLKVGLHKMFGSEALFYADFCLGGCPAGLTTGKQLRLYSPQARFLGVAVLEFTIPKVLLPSAPSRAIPAKVFEPVMDDIASLVATYTPKELRRLDLSIYRGTDCKQLHKSYCQQLIPSVVGTVYLGIEKVVWRQGGAPGKEGTYLISASVGDYSVEALPRIACEQFSTLYPYGRFRDGPSTFPFPLMRVDITPTGPAAVLTISVLDKTEKGKRLELARSVVSLRALLTPTVFAMSETVQVPLVKIRAGVNKVNASLAGTLRLRLYPSAFETYPATLRLPPAMIGKGFQREYVRYYMHRIAQFLAHYDANGLTDIHVKVYDQFVARDEWRRGLPDYLAQLITRWGPEVDTAAPPPPLHGEDDNASVTEGGRFPIARR